MKFKLADITPTHKNDDTTDKKNYNSILPTVLRIFENMIYNQICGYLKSAIKKLSNETQLSYSAVRSNYVDFWSGAEIQGSKKKGRVGTPKPYPNPLFWCFSFI